MGKLVALAMEMEARSLRASQMESWLPVEGWPYDVSNLGRVRRTSGRMSGRILKGDRAPEGYVRVALYRHPDRQTHLVSIMVCTAFHGPRPTPGHEAAHLDGCPWNNTEHNLKWKTAKENAADRRRHARDRIGEDHYNSKLRELDVKAILALLQTDRFTKLQIAEMFGVSDGQISHIEFGRSWMHIDRTGFTPNRVKKKVRK